MLPGLRAPTPFELFLQRRQNNNDSHDSPGAAASNRPRMAGKNMESQKQAPPRISTSPPRLPQPAPAPLPTSAPSAFRAPDNRSVNSNIEPPSQSRIVKRPIPDLSPQVVVSLPSPRLPGGAPGLISDTNAPSGQRLTPGTTAVYGELASAAASLASVAHKLARGTAADRNVAASYQTLAQAAADLAASACLIRPLSSSPSGALNNVSNNKSAPQPRVEARNPSVLPRAVDPMASAAAAAAVEASTPGPVKAASNSVTASGPVKPIAPVGGACGPGARPRVLAPRFPGYNPMIHFIGSDLPPPGTSDSSRPDTSSPITHQLLEARHLNSSGGASTSSPSRQLHGRRYSSLGPHRNSTSAYDDPPNAQLLHTSDLLRLPMYSLGASADGAPPNPTAGAGTVDMWWRNERTPAGGAGGRPDGSNLRTSRRATDTATAEPLRSAVEPLSYLSPFMEPSHVKEAAASADIDPDDLDMRYNRLLAALRERVYARGANKLTAAFRDVDREGSGMLSHRDFASVLRGLNLGAPGLVDDKVVDLMVAGMESSSNSTTAAAGAGLRGLSRIPYSEFVNAIRFDVMPWRGGNGRLRPRAGPNPDQPLGPSSMAAVYPYGLLYGDYNGKCAASQTAPAAAAATLPFTTSQPHNPAVRNFDLLTDGGGSPGAHGSRPQDISVGASLEEVRAAFRNADANGDGVVEWGEFREALRRLGEQHHLQLTEQEVLQAYQEADPDFSRGVDYEAFVTTHSAGLYPPVLNADGRGGGSGGGALVESLSPKPHRGNSNRILEPLHWRQPPAGHSPGTVLGGPPVEVASLWRQHAGATTVLRRLGGSEGGALVRAPVRS